MSTAAESPLVLVIEDDPICAGILTEILSALDAEVVRARKLADAQILINTRKFQLLFIDGLLPDGSGEDFVRRNRDLLANTHLVFCSAFFRRFGAHEKLKKELGVERVLNKPFTRAEVVNAALAHLPMPKLKEVPPLPVQPVEAAPVRAQPQKDVPRFPTSLSGAA